MEEDDLPRERIVYPAPSTCPCCGGRALRKNGEDVTETLDLVPRQWKLIQHVRFSCRACEAIADDTTVPVLAKDKTRTGRLWTYVRDDRPFAGPDPPAVVEHPEQHSVSYAG